tara:strand:- start:422 stop:1102 length:681 start_codon:yes stop_codon:yes gene_type:complete
MSDLKNIIVIPARKNSKRFRGKNLSILDGKPLISHTIEYALKFASSNRIWVNTDDELIIDLSKKYNINNYLRPTHLAEDNSTTAQVIVDFALYLVKQEIQYEKIITLQPTNPIRPDNLFNNACKSIDKSKKDSLMSVSLLNKKFGKISKEKYLPSNYIVGQRHQEIEPLYYENGLIYITSKKLLLSKNKLISENVYPLVTDHIGSNIDIDYEDDLKLAELIIKLNK